MPSRFISITVFVATALLGLAAAATATDRDGFDKRLRKYVLRFDEVFDANRTLKPRGMCACTPGLTPGFLYHNLPDNDQIVCLVPSFGSDGALESASPCSSYQVLSQ